MATPWLLISQYDANRIRRLMRDVLIGTRGAAFVRIFYEHLFEKNPEIRPLFPINMAKQARKLLLTISVVVKHLDREAELQQLALHLRDVHSHIRIDEGHIEMFLVSLAHAFQQVHGCAFPNQDWRNLRRAIFSLCSAMLSVGNHSGRLAPTN